MSADIHAAFADFFAAPLEACDIAALREHGGIGRLAPLGESAAGRRARGVLDGFADVETATSELNAAYCCLFLGAGGPHGNAAPYESAWSGSGRLFGEPSVEMAKLLAAHGMALAEGVCGPADHLAIELALLAALPEGADALALRERLLGWLPRFAARCAECDTTGFYAALAALLLDFLREQASLALSAPLVPFDREISA